MTGIRVKARVALVVAFTLLVSLLGPLAHQVEATPAQTGPPSSMDALGDSITRGYNTAGFFVDNVAQSWSSGTDTGVNSIYRRILALNPAISGKNFNDAVTGAKMSGLDGQAANAVARNPELVTILLGANDVCASSEAAMTSVATFRAQFLTGMQRLSTNLPNSRIFVSSIPNIFNLWNVLRTNATARSTWSLFGICQAMLANSNSTAAADVARRARVQQRNIDFNTQLSEVCAQFIHCRFDNNAAYNLSFLSTDVSTWDYFHPNTAGQTKAAATLWNAGFNYSDTTAPNTTITTDRGADGVDGWYRNDVTVSLSSTDNVAVSGSEFFYQLQGAAGTLPWTRYTGPFTINTAGITNITARTVDVNGNIDASKALAVKIDKTAPTLSITCPSGNVPRNSAATSTVTATDALSGFAVDPSGTFPVDTSTLGVNPHQVTVADRAGNSTTKSCSYTVVDVTAPTISIAAPVSGQSIARDAAVAADFSCADETGGSGLATCVGTVADGANIDTAALGDHSFTVNAKDNAGNTSTKTVHYSVVDETPPSITISSPTDGQTIAQHEAVAADYGCTDEASGSGLATCVGTVANGADIDTSTLGSHDFTVNASDNAGNTSTKTVTYNVVDVTAPTIDISSPVDNATISRDAAVAAGYSCADEAAGSGVATCVGTVANGADIDTSTLGSHDFTVNASDNAGNTSTKTVTYTVVDVTPPTITITTPADGSSVARDAVVAADYACADEAGGSGVASCVGTVADGADIDTSTLGSHSFKVDAKDNAGNTSTKTVTYTVVDVTPPTITISSPAAGATFARFEVVAADYACADEAGGSGIDSCVGTVADGSNIDTSTIGSHSFKVDAKDNAGNTSTKSVTYTVVDVTPPTITITTPADGATINRNAVVAADYACADEAGGSGVASCVGTTANGSNIATSTLGSHSFKVDAKDNAGNTSTTTVTYTVVDVTGPTITVSAPTEGQGFLLGQAASAGYSCADEAGGSGLASCVGTIANGGSLNTSTVGAKSFTITAKDNAGNTTTKTVHYNVIYAFGGVLQPINADGSSLFKLGSTVPVKFQLRNSAGALVPSANATLTVAKISNGVIGVDVEAISTSAASTGNAFRCDGGQCIFNLATKPLSQGTYQLTITLDDGTQQKVIISLR